MLLPTLAIALGPLAASFAADDPARPATAATTDGDAIRARFEVDLIDRGRAVFALPDGPRTIRAFRWIPAPGPADTWRSARLRLVWDGDDPEAAGVDLPLGRFLAEEAAGPGPGGDPGPILVNRRPMPYRRSARLVLDADGPVRGSIRLDIRPGAEPLDRRGYLRAALLADPDRDGDVPGELVPDPGGEGGPAVRYWYDPGPGPVGAAP